MPLDRGGEPERWSSSATTRDRGRPLRCRACGIVITSEGERIDVGGAHAHTFCNPHGHMFGIGCFAAAPGCRQIGPATEFYSWFPGYAWRMSVCSGCGTHLGWSYGERPSFWGLILAELVEDGDGQG